MKCSETWRMGSQLSFQHAELPMHCQCDFQRIPLKIPLCHCLCVRNMSGPLHRSSGVFHDRNHFRASVPPIISRASFRRSWRILFSSSPSSAARCSASAKNSSILFASTQASMISNSSSRLSFSALMRRRSSSSRRQIICRASHSCRSISALRSPSSTSRAMVAASRFSSLTIAESLPGKSPVFVSRHCRFHPPVDMASMPERTICRWGDHACWSMNSFHTVSVS